MSRFFKKDAAKSPVFVCLTVCLMAAGVLGSHLLFARQAPAKTASPAARAIPAVSPYIEAHTHFDEKNPEAAVQAALKGMQRQNASMIFFLAPPDTFDSPGKFDTDLIIPLLKKYPGKFHYMAGGGTLNPMIQQSVRSGDAGPEALKKFRAKAEELLRMGAVGLGEVTTEHFPSSTPYQNAPPDHPLFLLLADIAAEHSVPIILHMETVVEDMNLPADLKSPPNPPRLKANIPAFERLLSHNPRAKIIWAHLGSDYTGNRTIELTRRLLTAHPNLFMEIKTDPLNPGKNYPLDANGKLKPEWLKLFSDFSDRLILGSDQHYPEPQPDPQRWQTDVLLYNQLPADLQRKIGTDNVYRIYPIKPSSTKSGGFATGN
jgi:predicted TIM-barrel fold metal-dependent hydrolase